MNRIPWILLVAVVALAVVLLRHVSGNVGRGAEELLAAARNEATTGGGDTGLVLGTLNTALELARQEGDDDLVEAVLRERAELLMRRRAYPPARRDFEALLELGTEDPEWIEARLVALEVASGNWRAGIETGRATLALHPKHTGALVQTGRACEAGADELFAGVRQYLSDVLPLDTLPLAAAAALRATHLPPGSPGQVESFGDLLDIFRDEGLSFSEEQSEELRAISELRAESQRHFAAASRGRVNPAAAVSLLGSLIEAGHGEEAAFLARYALEQRGDVRTNQIFVQHALKVMLGAGRGAEAADLATDWYREFGSGSVAYPTLVELSRALYLDQRWEALVEVGEHLLSVAPTGDVARSFRDTAHFVLGMAAVHQEDEVRAEDHLGRLRAPDAEPEIEGALFTAFLELARIAREDDRFVDERTILQRLCLAHPRRADLAWERLVELHELSNPDREAGLRALTDALRAVPERAPRWRERWYELARANFARHGRELSVLAADVASGRAALADLLVSPTDGVLVVRRLLDDDRPGPARYNALLLAEELRDFPLLEELQFEAARRSWRSKEALDHAVKLLSWGVADDEVASYLRRAWVRGDVESQRILDIVRSGTAELAALFFSRGLLAQGEYGQVVTEIARWRADHPGERLDLLGVLEAEARLALGEVGRALDALLAIPAGSRAYADAIVLHARIVAASGDDADFDELLERLDRAPQIEFTERLDLARTLLSGDHGAWALRVLENLHSDEVDLNARLFELRAMASLSMGDIARAEEFLARGRAFAREVDAQLISLLFAVSDGDREAVDAAAEDLDLRASPPSVRCALAVLRGDPILSRALLPTARLPEPALRPLWSVLWRAVSPDVEPPPELALDARVEREFERVFRAPVLDRDAQARFAACVLAADVDRVEPWLRQTLGRLEAREGLWQGYLAWLIERRRSGPDGRLDLGIELVGAFPFLDDVWSELAARAARAPSRMAATEVARAWAARPRATFPEPDQPPILTIAGRALLAEEDGREDEALEGARTLANTDTQHPLAHLITARIFAARGLLSDALTHYADAIEHTQSVDAVQILAEYLDVVSRAVRAGLVGGATQSERLLALATRFEGDETLEAHRALASVLAWRGAASTAGLGDHAENLRSRVNAFEAQLAQRTAQTGRALGVEAAAAWAEAFLLSDPETGVRAFENQLAAGPTRVDLWLHHLDLLVASERTAAADAASSRLVEIVGDGRVQRWRLAFVARERGSTADGVAELERLLERVDPSRLEAIRARLRIALWNGDDESLRAACDELWSLAAGTQDVAEVASTVACTRLLLREDRDVAAARTALRAGLAAPCAPARRAVLEVLAELAGLPR